MRQYNQVNTVTNRDASPSSKITFRKDMAGLYSKKGTDALIFKDAVEPKKHHTVIAGVDDSSKSLLFRNTLTTVDQAVHRKHQSLINQNSSVHTHVSNRIHGSRGGFNIDVRIQ